jgi:hypothetical protein
MAGSLDTTGEMKERKKKGSKRERLLSKSRERKKNKSLFIIDGRLTAHRDPFGVCVYQNAAINFLNCARRLPHRILLR